MPVTAARHMLMERYKAVSFQDGLVFSFLSSLLCRSARMTEVTYRVALKKRKNSHGASQLDGSIDALARMELTLPLRTGAGGFSEAELCCFLFRGVVAARACIAANSVGDSAVPSRRYAPGGHSKLVANGCVIFAQ